MQKELVYTLTMILAVWCSLPSELLSKRYAAYTEVETLFI